MECMNPTETNGLPSFADGLQILLVDHDTLSLMCTASTLEKYSFKVSTTALASVALSMIREQNDHYNLVMANINMPDKDRFSILRVLHKNEIPIIFMSSEVNINVAKKALAEGACFFLQKPISLEDLKNVWQHVYRKVRNPKKGTHKPNCAKKIDEIATENQTQGASGIKRPVDDKGEQENTKKVKLINTEQTVSQGTNKEEEGMENQDSNGSPKERKWRAIWTPELHLKFTEALSALGDQKARPKSILKWMNEPNITVRQVASHLQKYKKQVHRIHKAGATSLPSFSRSSSWNNRNEFPPARQTSLACRPYEQVTSSFGVRGNPAHLMTPNSFTRFNNHDYRRQDHQSESLYDFYLTTHGKFQNLNQTTETSSFSFALGADMNEMEKRNHPLGPSTNNITPEFASTNISANIFQLPNAPVSLNQAQCYTPAPTVAFNSQNQSQFSTEFTGANGQDQAQYRTPEPTSPFTAQIQNHFSVEVTGTIEVGMNQSQYYTPAPTAPFISQNQNQFSTKVTGTTEVLEVVPEQIASGNAANADFNGGSQQLDPAAGEALPASSNNNQPMLEYTDLLKLLEEDPEELNWFDSAPNAGDANHYCEWLTEALLEDSSDPHPL